MPGWSPFFRDRGRGLKLVTSQRGRQPGSLHLRFLHRPQVPAQPPELRPLSEPPEWLHLGLPLNHQCLSPLSHWPVHVFTCRPGVEPSPLGSQPRARHAGALSAKPPASFSLPSRDRRTSAPGQPGTRSVLAHARKAAATEEGTRGPFYKKPVIPSPEGPSESLVILLRVSVTYYRIRYVTPLGTTSVKRVCVRPGHRKLQTVLTKIRDPHKSETRHAGGSDSTLAGW